MLETCISPFLLDILLNQDGKLVTSNPMQHISKWLGITTAALLICLEAVSVDARTQQSLRTDSVLNLNQLAQARRPFRRPLRNQDVIRVPILERRGGIPIVGVTLNNDRTFPMLVDTGASITIITPTMARAVDFRPQGKEKIRIASGDVIEMPRGSLSSMNVGDAQSSDVTVLVGSAPLLGQNFFKEYNVTIAEKFIVFRRKLR